MPLPKGNLSGLDMASKLESVIILSGFSPSAGATHTISLKLSGFATHIRLAIGAPLICLLCSSPSSIVASSKVSSATWAFSVSSELELFGCAFCSTLEPIVSMILHHKDLTLSTASPRSY